MLDVGFGACTIAKSTIPSARGVGLYLVRGFRIRCAALRQKAFIGFVNLKQFTISMR